MWREVWLCMGLVVEVQGSVGKSSIVHVVVLHVYIFVFYFFFIVSRRKPVVVLFQHSFDSLDLLHHFEISSAERGGYLELV